MNKSKWFLTGMAALSLSFGLVLTGCETDSVISNAAASVISVQSQARHIQRSGRQRPSR